MIVNGENMDFHMPLTVKELLEKLNLKIDTVVVELDRTIIEKHKYSLTKLNSSSEVEIIRFVGGG